MERGFSYIGTNGTNESNFSVSLFVLIIFFSSFPLLLPPPSPYPELFLLPSLNAALLSVTLAEIKL